MPLMLAFGNVLMHGTKSKGVKRHVRCRPVSGTARRYAYWRGVTASLTGSSGYANRRLGTENRLNMRFVLVSPDLAGQFVLVSAR